LRRVRPEGVVTPGRQRTRDQDDDADPNNQILARQRSAVIFASPNQDPNGDSVYGDYEDDDLDDVCHLPNDWKRMRPDSLPQLQDLLESPRRRQENLPDAKEQEPTTNPPRFFIRHRKVMGG
jgi:hypothetical protein